MSKKKEIHFNKLNEYRQQLEQDFPELAIRGLKREFMLWHWLPSTHFDAIIELYTPENWPKHR